MTAPSASGPLVRLEVPADLGHLNIISACLAALLEAVADVVDRDVQTYNLQLAVQEASTNIVEYAYGGHSGGRIAIEFSLSDSPRQLAIDLYDNGSPFDASLAFEPNLDEPQIHGYGLFLMRELTDDVGYERVQECNHWRLVKRL